jgi:putative ABC transport system permease protein
MIREIGRSIRRLVKRPGLTVTAVATLALAIGANTAIYSLLDTVALRPLPYREADRLILLGSAVSGLKDLRPLSWPKYQTIAAQSRATTAVTAYYQGPVGLTERDRPEELQGVRVSASFFAVWEVQPIVGRTFTADEEKQGGANVALLSYGFWRKRFAGSRDVVGRSVDIDGRPTTVIGVLPDTLRFPFKGVQIWLPRPDDVNFMSRKLMDMGAGYLQVVGRLRPGITQATAQQEMDRIDQVYKTELPGQIDLTYPLTAKPLTELLVGSTRTNLLVLLAGVGLVLLIACADVANLLLADGLARRRETAVLVALGAGRRHVFGQTLRESLLIAAAGGGLGVLLADWGLRLLVATQPADLPRIDDVSLSGHALVYSFAITALAGLLAGIGPAWQTLRTDPKSFLGEGGRGGAGSKRAHWAQGLLVTGQIALALVLLSAAGLLLRSLNHVNGTPLGFEPDNLMFVQISLPDAKYPGTVERRVFFEGLLERVRHLPGVEVASLIDSVPTTGVSHTKVAVEGEPPVPPDKQPLVGRLVASSGYLSTLHSRIAEGHDLDPKLPPDAPMTALVNRSLQKVLFPGKDPLGRRLLLRGGLVKAEIVGVVEDIQQEDLESGMTPLLILSHHQLGPDMSPPSSLNLVIRSRQPVAGMAEALRHEVNAVDPSQPMPEITTASQLLSTGTARRRLTTGLFSAFSALALVLCLLGIYGVVAHSIFLRRREIGVRMALGASRRQVLGGVLQLGARWILPGLAIGLIGSYFAGRALGSQLFEIEGTDWPHFLASAVILNVVAFLACLLPGRKATKIDPAIALRTP